MNPKNIDFTNIDFKILFFSALVAIIGGSTFYRFIENWSWLDSAYFSVMTLTTIGYGDFVPTTPLSKLFTIFYVFIGIGIIFGLIRVATRRGLHRAHRNGSTVKKK